MTNWQEENAKAEMIGAGISVGCGAIVLFFILIIGIAALFAG